MTEELHAEAVTYFQMFDTAGSGTITGVEDQLALLMSMGCDVETEKDLRAKIN